MLKIVKKALRPLKPLLRKYLLGSEFESGYPPDLSDASRKIVEAVRPYTMTTTPRIVAMIHAVEYLVRNKIAGEFVECGVYRGGSMMAAASVLAREGDVTRELYLYDTFEGMTEPTSLDRDHRGRMAADLLARHHRDERGVWCYATLEDVHRNLTLTGYPLARMHFIKGKVEETIPATMPEQIALLRLDTDWYESTKHELEYLYPRLVPGGVLIIDDYGHWQGCRQAVDEYFGENLGGLFLHRLDYTGRLAIRPAV